MCNNIKLCIRSFTSIFNFICTVQNSSHAQLARDEDVLGADALHRIRHERGEEGVDGKVEKPARRAIDAEELFHVSLVDVHRGHGDRQLNRQRGEALAPSQVSSRN